MLNKVITMLLLLLFRVLIFLHWQKLKKLHKLKITYTCFKKISILHFASHILSPYQHKWQSVIYNFKHDIAVNTQFDIFKWVYTDCMRYILWFLEFIIDRMVIVLLILSVGQCALVIWKKDVVIGYRTSRKGYLYSAHYRTRGNRGQIDIKNKWSLYVYGPFRELKKNCFFVSFFFPCMCSMLDSKIDSCVYYK